ncbi:MAG: acyl-CoA thioesterase [Pirellulales bacterium]|nr:acyl-CoA thioesterase [Pirellulales bacterium]
MKKTVPNAIYRHEFTVPKSAVDQNGHVNNVVYVQWMQDVAVLHSRDTGGTAAMHAAGATWVARSHWIEYLSPTFAGDEVVALSWVVDFRRVRSMRRYRFFRKSDNVLLAKGETDWVSVDADSGRPRKIPPQVAKLFTLVPENEEPPTFTKDS